MAIQLITQLDVINVSFISVMQNDAKSKFWNEEERCKEQFRNEED
jgi:hypothetical protein